MSIKRIHLTHDGHRMMLGNVPLMSRTLEAGRQAGGKQLRFELADYGVIMLLETEVDSGAKHNGMPQFNAIHTFPWPEIMQLDHEDERYVEPADRLDLLAEMVNGKVDDGKESESKPAPAGAANGKKLDDVKNNAQRR